MKVDQAKRLKDLKKENARLRKAVSDLTLDKVILNEALSGILADWMCVISESSRALAPSSILIGGGSVPSLTSA